MTTVQLAAFAAYLVDVLEQVETALSRGDVPAVVALLERIATDTTPQVADRVTRRVVAQGLRRLADRIELRGGEL